MRGPELCFGDLLLRDLSVQDSSECVWLAFFLVVVFLTTCMYWSLYVNLVSGFLLTHSCPLQPRMLT